MKKDANISNTYALRSCHKAKEKHKADALERPYRMIVQNILAKYQERKAMLPSVMGSSTGNKAVAAVWKKHIVT